MQALSKGVYDTYTATNLRYSQVAPLGIQVACSLAQLANAPVICHPS